MRGDDAVADQAYDEAIAVESDDDEVSTPASSEPGSPSTSGQPSPATNQRPAPSVAAASHKAAANDSDSESSSSEASSSADDATSPKAHRESFTGAYNPDDFKDMKVSAEVEELFQYIPRYKPHTIELDTTLKAFIPELIPSIGEVDAFLKMPRPDEKSSTLGTVQLDEPTMNPSDPSILDLQLRHLSKNQDLQPMEVRSIENSEKCPKEIENWIMRIEELKRTKPAPMVQYSKRMPDIEQLMQVWPSEFEDFLQGDALPELADLELDLKELVKVIAAVLDVPVHSQITETLHVIFTLYSEFKSNQHFSKMDGNANFGANDPYSFAQLPFGQTVGPGIMGPALESMAPSRAPSPQGPYR